MAKNQTNNETINTPEAEESKKKEQVKLSKQNEKNKKKKEKKDNKLVQSLRGLGSEFKKITWPTFKTVVKQTGVVLAAVVVFLVVIFGFDRLLSLLFDLFVSAIG